jgi:hypothetical protein
MPPPAKISDYYIKIAYDSIVIGVCMNADIDNLADKIIYFHDESVYETTESCFGDTKTLKNPNQIKLPIDKIFVQQANVEKEDMIK